MPDGLCALLSLAVVPLYLHALLLPALVITAGLRVHASSTGAAPLSVLGLVGVAATLAWLGVLPNVPVMHEMVHHRGRIQRGLAFLMAVVIADPLRRLAHVRAHHAKVGLAEDSDTARRGETIYGFILRAAVSAMHESISSEQARLAKRGRSIWSWRSDVVHSMNPQVPFYALIPDADAPQMPSALLCFMAALVPPLWVRLIAKPRLRHWDEHFASADERALAALANATAGWST